MPHVCRRSNIPLGLLACCVSALSAIGCGDGLGLVEVVGTVSLDGKPLTSGRVSFFPEKGRPSSGQIDSEGRYRLATYQPGDGALPGSYVVTVSSRQESEEPPMYQSLEDEMNGVQSGGGKGSPGGGRAKWLAPPRYANRTSSGLTAEVPAGGGEIDFPLSSQP